MGAAEEEGVGELPCLVLLRASLGHLQELGRGGGQGERLLNVTRLILCRAGFHSITEELAGA